jgi:hypothetical protein
MTSAAAVAHAASPAAHSGSGAPTQINLSGAYHAALKAEATHTYGEAGIVRPVGYRVAESSASCKEPNCNLTYHGGLVQTKPVVYLVLWGPKWKESTYSSEVTLLKKIYGGLGTTSDHWSTTTSQYRDKEGGHPTFGHSVLKGVFNDINKPPTLGQTQIAAEAAAFARTHNLHGSNIQVVVAAQSGTCYSDGFAGSCGRQNPNGQYCAYHGATSSTGISYTNLPYMNDAGPLCGSTYGKNAGFSIVGGHEYAESITDPYPASGWVDDADNVSGGEIGDKCAWGGQAWGGNDPIGPIKFSTGTFIMQSLWSNSAHACKQ